MYKSMFALLLSTLFLLAACGGGSSSGGGDTEDMAQATDDGGASGGGTADPDDDDGIAGTYVGPGTITVSSSGFSENLSDTLQVVISQNGTVSFGSPGAPPDGTTSLNADGNTFAVNIPASVFNEPGLDCEGALSATGTINGDTITGTITGSGVSCNGIPLSVTGSFKLEKTGAGTQSRAGGGLLQRLRGAIPDAVH